MPQQDTHVLDLDGDEMTVRQTQAQGIPLRESYLSQIPTFSVLEGKLTRALCTGHAHYVSNRACAAGMAVTTGGGAAAAHGAKSNGL